MPPHPGRDPVLNKQKNGWCLRKDTGGGPLASLCAHTSVLVHTCTHTHPSHRRIFASTPHVCSQLLGAAGVRSLPLSIGNLGLACQSPRCFSAGSGKRPVRHRAKSGQPQPGCISCLCPPSFLLLSEWEIQTEKFGLSFLRSFSSTPLKSRRMKHACRFLSTKGCSGIRQGGQWGYSQISNGSVLSLRLFFSLKFGLCAFQLGLGPAHYETALGGSCAAHVTPHTHTRAVQTQSCEKKILPN